jgi:hypothetical protein
MKIYFAGSIRGGRDDIDQYLGIIDYLKQYGEVLTEHVGDKNLNQLGEGEFSDEYIHNRDIKWMLLSDILVAEVSTASLGVGYEIGRAVENNKKVLCLYRPQEDKRLSAMISGSSGVVCVEYKDLEEAKGAINGFLSR